jgi:hypothetical protein
MLMIHNTKVDRIMKTFKNNYDIRKKAKDEGLTIDEISKTMTSN